MKDIIKQGDRFNHYTIIKEVPKKGDGRRFLCRCDCGNEKEVDLRNLKNGNVKSCGKCNYTEIRIGDKFGHWTVIGDYIKDVNGCHKKYLCECDCVDKTQKYVDEQNLKRGLSNSCGCLTKEITRKNFTTHGLTKTRLYKVWIDMRSRCYNPNVRSYKDYGKKGIKVCPEWKDDFFAFWKWAYQNGYDDSSKYGECTLDRINVEGNYEPTNCRWINAKMQSNNRTSNVIITYNGESHNITQWSEITGIKSHTIGSRYRKGMPLDDVFYKGNLKKR